MLTWELTARAWAAQPRPTQDCQVLPPQQVGDIQATEVRSLFEGQIINPTK